MGTYTTKKGDSLWNIAKTQMGTKSNADTSAAVRRLWNANKSSVSQPKGGIGVGVKLTIPGAGSKAPSSGSKGAGGAYASSGANAKPATQRNAEAKAKELGTKSTARPSGNRGPSQATQKRRTDNQAKANKRAG